MPDRWCRFSSSLLLQKHPAFDSGFLSGSRCVTARNTRCKGSSKFIIACQLPFDNIQSIDYSQQSTRTYKYYCLSPIRPSIRARAHRKPGCRRGWTPISEKWPASPTISISRYQVADGSCLSSATYRSERTSHLAANTLTCRP